MNAHNSQTLPKGLHYKTRTMHKSGHERGHVDIDIEEDMEIHAFDRNHKLSAHEKDFKIQVDNLSKITLDAEEDVLYIQNLFDGFISFKETIPFML